MKLVCNGVVEELKATDLLDAQKEADKSACYCQSNMYLLTNDGEVWARTWWGCTDGIEVYDNPIRIGDYGFYGDWWKTKLTPDQVR